MASAKDIIVKVISSKDANEFVKKHHYSGKVVNNSSLHLGAFLDNRLHGVMSFGPPMDKKKVLGLVENTGWNEMLELNRMAFDPVLPKNSESRCIAISVKMLRKNAPHVKWILYFSDATQCGDGAIYRASGFMLTGIKKNNQIWIAPDSDTRKSRVALTDNHSPVQKALAQKVISRMSKTKGSNAVTGAASMKPYIEAGFKPLDGFQLRYIYLIDKTCKLTVPTIPFNKIDELGAGMYRGKKISIKERNSGVDSVCSNTPSFQDGEDVQVDLNAPLEDGET
jgi:hypothetical protein